MGPEAVVKALARVRGFCRAVLVGEASVWRRAGWRPGSAPIVDTRLGGPPPRPGRASPAGGLLALAALDRAWGLLARGICEALVTAPVSKTSWAMAGSRHLDHTGWIEAQTGRRTRMILGSPRRGLWCLTATRHMPLSEVPKSLSAGEALSCAKALDAALRRLGLPRPRLGLCALNPHAGEGGLLGSEERRIVPAVRNSAREGLQLIGPIPADAAWRLHAAGGLDGLVCLYHDQALIGLKAAAGLEVVQWTWGLPWPRLSPGHGTAFDIAGRGLADPTPTVEAARLAARLARRLP